MLFVAPEASDAWWPWDLTALTGRAVGAWLTGIGTAAAHAALENDWRRVEILLHTYWIFAALQFVAIGRYADALAWNGAEAWLYAAFMASALGVGAYGWRVARRVVAEEATPSRGGS
ncbi:hypothetical protein ER308_16685 [Egibacter rhizosphaerae]|uniref:Uncharacterized protein n=1 Tax=Egibacter rhizosphaerae TaxID=1670831 RepID=A0A411YIM2_9ACTN|nr:hypothetical protein [Egibacter rhizosphaerae]QBI21047.1 hypothetical protein ER308_16685 [Egibacter rhizosphaerae]